MKIIFLDIDGVLNQRMGLEKDKLLILKTIVDKTNARIVLISSWKEYLTKDCKSKNFMGSYLLKSFHDMQLSIYDRTISDGLSRSKGIQQWLRTHEVSSYIILDDNLYDYSNSLLDHLIFIEHHMGLQEYHIPICVEKLKTSLRDVIA
ncbi:HAD domain-containing protein [Floccifex sp.]|uniref:HAD domain-containing protein n=1 Tax=Floccifex sp. TaxID=2815810 RepID=UPI003F0F1CFB